MITVQLSGTALTVRGHAGFSRYGSDIVCAAASMLAFTLAAAMEEADIPAAIMETASSARIPVPIAADLLSTTWTFPGKSSAAMTADW